MEENLSIVIPDEVILNKILVLRGKKVLLDRDLAELYGVPTKRLNEQVKRNLSRFPEDFMFQLTRTEKESLIANHKFLSVLKFSAALPYVFTEHGAVMLASVLNSEKAIAANIQVVRIFTSVRQLIWDNAELRTSLEKLEKKSLEHSSQIERIIQYIDFLAQENEPAAPRKPIGFRRKEE